MEIQYYGMPTSDFRKLLATQPQDTVKRITYSVVPAKGPPATRRGHPLKEERYSINAVLPASGLPKGRPMRLIIINDQEEPIRMSLQAAFKFLASLSATEFTVVTYKMEENKP